MSRYIDADELMRKSIIPLMKSTVLINSSLNSLLCRVANEILLSPTIDLKEETHSFWLPRYKKDVYCIKCGYITIKRTNYCPQCGANMGIIDYRTD